MVVTFEMVTDYNEPNKRDQCVTKTLWKISVATNPQSADVLTWARLLSYSLCDNLTLETFRFYDEYEIFSILNSARA